MLSLEQVEHNLNLWHFPAQPWHLGKIGGFAIDLNPKTMIMTWLTMAVVLVFAILATRRLDVRKPGKLQAFFEVIWEFIKGLVDENMDPKKGASLLSLLVTLFVFLLFSNLLGLIPTLSSPTADINTTFGLAIMVLILIQIYGMKYKGAGHFKHFLQPFAPFIILNLVEEVAKPITLAFRLYGNIYAGEVLIAVLLGLLGLKSYIFGGFLPSVIWLGFSVFVGAIQAFIFTMLTIAYVAQVVADHH